MQKTYTLLLSLGLLGLTACSQADDPVAAPEAPAGTHSIDMCLTRAAAEDFAKAGIDKYTVYIYKVERKGTSLFAEKEMNATAGTTSIEFPLGETYQTVAVANAASVEGKESLETLAVVLNPAADSQVWLSETTRFASDKSISSVSLALQRVVAQVNFAAAEDEATLAAQTTFDRVDATFHNVSTRYMVSRRQAEATTYTVTLNAANGYKATFHSFDTSKLEGDVLIGLSYLKGGSEVNTSAGLLETATRLQANNRYSVTMPLTSPDFVSTPWSFNATRGILPAKISVTSTKL